MMGQVRLNPGGLPGRPTPVDGGIEPHRLGIYVRDKGHKGPQDQYSFVSIYRDHAIGVMSSVFRASPRDTWPDRVMSLQVLTCAVAWISLHGDDRLQELCYLNFHRITTLMMASIA